MPAKASTPDNGANGQAPEAASPAVAIAASTGSALSREAHNFLADIEDLVKATTSLTGEDLARAKAQLAERIAAAKAAAGRMGTAIADGSRDVARATDGFVHEHPWQAIGVGAALGVLVGVLVARRA